MKVLPIFVRFVSLHLTLLVASINSIFSLMILLLGGKEKLYMLSLLRFSINFRNLSANSIVFSTQPCSLGMMMLYFILFHP